MSSILARNEKAASIWNAGGEHYDRISRQIADAIEHSVDRLHIGPSDNVLDVATGTGWTARRACARGAQVTGIDICSTAVETARRLDETRSIDFHVGDAEALPFADQQFDKVISTFGVMFCGNPAAAAAELVRVCRPGGRIALAIWDTQGGVYDMFRMITSHKPKSSGGGPSPFDWANPDRLREWFGENCNIAVEQATSYYREARAEDAWEAFHTGYGPVKTLHAALDEQAAEAFRQDFISFHERHMTPLGMLVPRPYLVAVIEPK